MQEAGDDVVAKGGDEAAVDALVDDEEGASVLVVDPVVGGAAQAEPLAGDILARRYLLGRVLH